MVVKKPHYILFCFVAIIVGCLVGAVWFELAFAARDSSYKPFGLLPLTIFDSFLVGWFPALLFGALLHELMRQLQWQKIWEWALGGGLLAWVLFCVGGWVGKAGVGSFMFMLSGVTLLKNMFGHTWPAAICGAAVSAILWWVARKVAPVATPAAAS